MRGEEKAIRGMELSLSRHLNHQVMLKPPSFPHSPRFFSLFLLKWLRAKFVSLSTSFFPILMLTAHSAVSKSQYIFPDGIFSFLTYCSTLLFSICILD